MLGEELQSSTNWRENKMKFKSGYGFSSKFDATEI